MLERKKSAALLPEDLRCLTGSHLPMFSNHNQPLSPRAFSSRSGTRCAQEASPLLICKLSVSVVDVRLFQRRMKQYPDFQTGVVAQNVKPGIRFSPRAARERTPLGTPREPNGTRSVEENLSSAPPIRSGKRQRNRHSLFAYRKSQRINRDFHVFDDAIAANRAQGVIVNDG